MRVTSCTHCSRSSLMYAAALMYTHCGTPLRVGAICEPLALEADDAIVADTAGYLPAVERTRLVRILRKGEAQTGVKIRVLTRSRAASESSAWAYEPSAARCRLGVAAAPADSILIVGDRGIAGALEAGSAFLTFEVGGNVRVSLPDIFFARLRQEYGRRSFVEARGEAASLIVAVELILTCLRSEEGFCTNVPPASTYF
jgi:hypothetical protein